MVSRCGYYVSKDKIIQRNVSIEWDLGFDKKAKHEYIKRICLALGEDVGLACDVTTASPIYETRRLSPVFISMRNSELTVEDYYQQIIKPKCGYIPGLMELAYAGSLTSGLIKTIQKYDCFIDVFHNPEKRNGCTQALACAIVKWAINNDRGDIFSTQDGFIKWYLNKPLIIEDFTS